MAIARARARRLALLAGLVAGAWLLASAPAATAHGALERTEPAAGAALARAPAEVRLTFSEAPERRLSAVKVIDSLGRPVGAGPAMAVPGAPATLAVRLPGLRPGTYTVSWRVTSAVDGHLTSGAFSFGVGVPAPATPAGPAAEQRLAGPAPLAVAGRLAWVLGLFVLVGAGATGLFTFGGRLPGPRGALLGAGLVAAAAGLVALTAAASTQAGAGLGAVLASTQGHWLLGRAAALVVAAGAAVAVARRPGRGLPLALLGVAAAGGLLAHALAGHAAAPSRVRWLELGAQWAHLVMAGVWIGGLAWLALGLAGHGRRPERTDAALRFSRLATVSLAVVVATGLIRAVAEVGGWGGLTGTAFGRALLVKLALFGGLLGLGAVNHFRLVPGLRAGRAALGRLRGSVRGELALASGVLLSAALLATLPPGPARPAPAPVVPELVRAAGADYTTSVRVTLSVSPGTAGPNRFSADVVDYDSGQPVPAERVWLSCSLPERPDLGVLEVDLARTGAGAWAATGSALPLVGRWDVRASIEAAVGTWTVPLEVPVAPGHMTGMG